MQLNLTDHYAQRLTLMVEYNGSSRINTNQSYAPIGKALRLSFFENEISGCMIVQSFDSSMPVE